MPRTSAPCFFLDLRGRFMPHMAISYIYEQREGEGEPFPNAVFKFIVDKSCKMLYL